MYFPLSIGVGIGYTDRTRLQSSDVGATVSDIRGASGMRRYHHCRYLQALRSDEKPHAEQVADLLGL